MRVLLMRGGVEVKTQQLHSELLQETVYHTRLPQGVEVFVLPKPGFQKKYAVFSTKYGSVDSRFENPADGAMVEVPEGIAHFLEHKLFESEDKPVFNRFAELGASANAYTSYTITSYLFSCTDNFQQALATLLDFVQHPYLTDENVEKEKGIIEQELRMYQDSPGRRVFTNLLQAMYHVNPVRIEIGGTVESIYRITKDDLYLCYNTFYHPSNMALFVVGDVDPGQVMDLAYEHILFPEQDRAASIRRFYPEEPETVKDTEVSEALVVSRPIAYLGLKENRLASGEQLLRQSLVTNILHRVLFGPTTELYTRLYESGLINEGFGAFYTAEPQFGFSALGGETSDPHRLLEEIQVELHRRLNEGLNPEEFLRQKRQAIGEFLHAFDSLEFIANNFIRYYFRGVSLFDYVRVLEGITLEDGEKRLKEHFAPEKMAVSIVFPKGR